MCAKLDSTIRRARSKAVECLRGIITRLAKTHYHEFPVRDSEGKIIGYEFFTTRGMTVVFVPKADRSDREVAPKQNKEYSKPC